MNSQLSSQVSNYQTFYFKGYDWDIAKKTLHCHYALDQSVHFTETVHFDFDFAQSIHEESLKSAFLGYFMMAGISYYKAGLPIQVEINSTLLDRLSVEQAEFFQKTYYHGLGELFYQNGITPFVPQFPHATDYQAPTNEYLPLREEVMVPLGGGKDSLTSVQLLQDAGMNFRTWTVGDYPGLIPSLKEIHGKDWSKQHLKIKRTIDPKLIELNQAGAINGHVPISSLWAFLSVITALLTNQKYIAFSNESSAEQPTLELNGEPINHQYSKTLEFETDFREYVQKFVHPDIEYFSLLRPFTELRIAEIFAKKAWPRFKDQFSSCNRNFTVKTVPLAKGDSGGSGPLFWCGECSKCAFVFLILSAFVPPGELLKVFGKNLFSDPNLKSTWEDLLGLTEHKPFECVGTIEEVRKAFILAKEKWPELSEWEKYLDLPDDFNYQAKQEHHVPEPFVNLLNV